MNRLFHLMPILAALMLLSAAPAAAGGALDKDFEYTLVNNSQLDASLHAIGDGATYDLCRAPASTSCSQKTHRNLSEIFVQYTGNGNADIKACTLAIPASGANVNITLTKDTQCVTSLQ